IARLDILYKTFPITITTKEVYKEFGGHLPSWISIRPVIDQARKNNLASIVDEGEASAIALALETKHSLLIIDEKKGRKLAAELQLEFIGTLQLLLIAKEKGVITF